MKTRMAMRHRRSSPHILSASRAVRAAMVGSARRRGPRRRRVVRVVVPMGMGRRRRRM